MEFEVHRSSGQHSTLGRRSLAHDCAVASRCICFVFVCAFAESISEEQLMQLSAQIAFRELSRTLESNFQRRERKFIHAAVKQIARITITLSALMCLPHRGVFRLVNSETRL